MENGMETGLMGYGLMAGQKVERVGTPWWSRG